VIAALEARMSDVVATGFYAPRGAGCVGQFAMLLAENRRSSAEIAEILGHAPDRAKLRYPETHDQRRATANDNAKHRVNRAKARLTKRVCGGTDGTSHDIPPGELVCVITTLNAGANQRISGYFAGREALQEVKAADRSDVDST